VPLFVLTHHARPPLEMEGGIVFHFVTVAKPWGTVNRQAIYATSRINQLRKPSSAKADPPSVLIGAACAASSGLGRMPLPARRATFEAFRSASPPDGSECGEERKQYDGYADTQNLVADAWLSRRNTINRNITETASPHMEGPGFVSAAGQLVEHPRRGVTFQYADHEVMRRRRQVAVVSDITRQQFVAADGRVYQWTRCAIWL
jgi:hypothetical protein